MKHSIQFVTALSLAGMLLAGLKDSTAASDSPDPEKLYEERTLVYTGEDYKDHPFPYRLLVPADYETGSAASTEKKWPLILFLHGAGERGDDNRAQLKYFPTDMVSPENRKKYPVFILAPQCPVNRAWSARDLRQLLQGDATKVPDETRVILGMLEKVQKEFPIDPERVYLTGLSMGGYGSWYLAALEPWRWAAVVPICGGGNPEWAPKMKDIPIWVFHGGRDSVVPPARSRQMVEALEKAGGKPKYTEFPDAGHNSWTPAYRHPEFLPWLFARKGTTGRAPGSDPIRIEGKKTVLPAPGNPVTWHVQAPEATTVDVSVTYACTRGSAGSKLEVACGDSTVGGEVIDTGDSSTFVTVPLGLLSVPEGTSEITLRTLSRPEGGDGILKVRQLELEQGFVSLFDGRTLESWTGSTEGYVVRDGVITCKPRGGGFLMTEKDYLEFIFRFEFKLPPHGNNGVGILHPRKGDPAYAGFEIQILDDPTYKGSIQPWQRHGSVYGVVAAEPGHLRPTGEWNTEEIRVQGTRITVTLNGTAIVDADIAEVRKEMEKKIEELKADPARKQEADRYERHVRAHDPGIQRLLDRKPGCICFCGHGSAVEFREIRVKDLSAGL